MTSILNLIAAGTVFFLVLIALEVIAIRYMDKHQKGDIHER